MERLGSGGLFVVECREKLRKDRFLPGGEGYEGLRLLIKGNAVQKRHFAACRESGRGRVADIEDAYLRMTVMEDHQRQCGRGQDAQGNCQKDNDCLPFHEAIIVASEREVNVKFQFEITAGRLHF